ncbi:hypothetical protein [Streptomyces sp. NPDC048481]|uniref:hypothetical protein n=1 Tax=Streptomyces sp. NPDC048481 TaxID=3365557 RepID=UPI0037180046
MPTTNRPEAGTMNGSREQSARSTRCARSTRAAQDAQAARDAEAAESPRAGRPTRPWAVLCAVAAVVLGPAAATASALEQANGAPPHHAVRVGRAQAYIPSDGGRRKSAA